jgi:hypothetical protein
MAAAVIKRIILCQTGCGGPFRTICPLYNLGLGCGVYKLTPYFPLHAAMKRLQDAGATSYLLDLQDNPGGLVQVLQFSHYPELCKCCHMLVIVCN